MRSTSGNSELHETLAHLGAVVFLITFMTLLEGTGEDSIFGYGFLPGILALVIWAIATSAATYRAQTSTRRGG